MVSEKDDKMEQKPDDVNPVKDESEESGQPEPGMDELIDMDQAIEILKTSRPTFYRWLRTGKVKGMKLGRQWRFYREDIERFLRGEEPKVELRADITPLIDILSEKVEELGANDPSKPDADELQRAINLMIVLAIAQHASDIHISSHINEQSEGSIAVIRNRVDGVLQLIAEFDIRLLPAIIEKWKTMASCDPREESKTQDGRIIIELSKDAGVVAGKRIDIRVGFLPAALGESFTARLLDSSVAVSNLSLDNIPYSERNMKLLKKHINSPWGLIVVTGPTGCGKTTILYCCLQELLSPKIKIMTIEDPVEVFLSWAVQVPVSEKDGLSFPVATRAALRQHPDVMLIGEIRDFQGLMIS